MLSDDFVSVFFFVKSAWIFAYGFQLHRKTSPCIFFCWFALRFWEMTYAKNPPFYCGIFWRSFVARETKKVFLFRFCFAEQWNQRSVTLTASWCSRNKYYEQVSSQSGSVQRHNICFFLRYISSSFYCSKHPFQEPMLWFPLNFTICKSLFFFSKTKDPFQEPVLSMQLDKQSRGQRPGHISANFESTQKIAELWVRFAWETLLCSFFPWFVLR